MAPSDVRLRAYLLAVALCGLSSSAIVLMNNPLARAEFVVLLSALTFLAEWMAFELPTSGSVSLAFAMNYAALLVCGPAGATLVAIAGSGVVQDVRAGKGKDAIAFNVGQLALSVQAAWLVYGRLGGVVLSRSVVSRGDYLTLLPAVLLSAAVLHLVNASLVAVVISLRTAGSFFAVWQSMLGHYIASFVTLTLLGFVLAQLLVLTGVPGALLLVVPFVIARQVFQVYEQMTRAYSETVRSLVTALEAKDAYTRGHSVRVAAYCRSLGEGAGLSGGHVNRLEYGALLHDIGKLAISNDILGKPGRLTKGEFEEIQGHPDSGRELLAGIDFLSDIIPMVLQHHERIDGSGYPTGCEGDCISTEARMLAISDAFDAMTSDRPYRPAMSFAQAAAELRDKSGSEFDEELVELFLDVITPALVRCLNDESMQEAV